jgi:type I restriction enzyme S subunit
MEIYPIKVLTELCEVLSGGTPKTTNPAYWNGLVPWASVKDFNTGNRWFNSTEKMITESGLSNCSSALLAPGELVLSARGTVGVVAQCAMSTAFNQSNYGLRAKESLASNDYLYYAISNAKKALLGDTHGGMFDTITRQTLARLNIPAPELEVQNGITNVLGTLDEKIQMNNQLSKTLEEIAQTIFKSWFIDFDPVKAKMAGEKPVGMGAATAALFPDSMEDSELGLIPKGWEVKSLDEVADYLNGLAMQKFPVTDETNVLPVIKISQLRSGNTFGADRASGLLDPKYIVQDGDILFSWSGTLEVEIWCGGLGALNQHLFKVTGRLFPDWFAYYATRHFLSDFRQIASGKATTMGHIQRRHLSEAKLATPPVELMGYMSSKIEPTVFLKVSIMKESKNLSEIRDCLLPRLISGELQIPEEMLVS